MAKFVLSATDAVARAGQTDRSFFSALRPVLIGPRAGLHRYSVIDEQADLGNYDKTTNTTYSYPDKTAGSTVDLASVGLYARTANLVYFAKYVGINGSAAPSSTYANRVRAANFVFATANGADRSAAFYDRDVQIGDTVKLNGTGTDAAVHSITSTVTGFIGEAVAAATASATAEVNNAATQSASVSISQVTDTPVNEVQATANGASYLSTADGYVTRTYTVTVTQSSTGSNATTARLRVRSADGGDDQDNVVPAAFASPTSVGTKGLTVTWSLTGSFSSGSSIDQDDFVVGQQWTVTVSQAFTAVVASSAGTYTGTKTTTYIATVTRGGRYADSTKPQITVTSSNGYDRSGPTTITAASTPFAAGSYGVTISFAGTYLRKGDVYYIVATAASSGAYKTLVLADNIPSTLAGQEVDVILSVSRSDLSIPTAVTYPTNFVNWTYNASGLTVKSGISIIDSAFTNGANPNPLVLDTASLVVGYREWVTTGVGDVIELTDAADIEASFGTVTPDNPIAYAALKALSNTSGELLGDPARPAASTTDRIMCVPIGGDPADLSRWSSAIDLVGSNDEAYALVPLDNTAAVQALFATHITAQSQDSTGFYRVGWFSRALAETGAVVSSATTSDHAAVTATIASTPATSPTAYTTLTASSNAAFVAKGVRAGDKVRIDFATNVFGAQTYTEYTIASVSSATTLVLVTGPNAAVGVARMIEVWRTYTKAELVSQLTAVAAGYADERIRLVFPDAPSNAGTRVGGYNLCAALAGLSGSVVSQQGLKNVGVVGFDDLTRSSKFFTASQLDALAAGGVFVVSQTPTGTVYVRNAVTTDPSTVATREEMIVRNADMVRKAIQDEWGPYVGSGNVVSNIGQLLSGALYSLTARLKAANHTSQLGPPVGNLSVLSIGTVTDTPDVLDVTVTATGLAVPLNQLHVLLPVSV